MSDAVPGSIYIDLDNMDWEPTKFPGIRTKVLWKDESSEAYTALFHFEPGASLPRHRHRGVEQTFVLEGSLADEYGECTAGNFVWREPGSIHSAHSPNGCLSIGIFQRTNEFVGEEDSDSS